MHRLFRKKLEDAEGISEFVIAVNLDIRGFSSFSKKVESPDVAMFIKRVYMKLIDNYFSDASFFKPTGDGLLITIPYTEKNLQQIARKTLTSCIQVLLDFDSFCTNDPMINFDVPSKIGIGLSRGTACRLVSKNKILDYSGRVLNLASKLMDLARPSGIVFDAEFGVGLFSDKVIKAFAKDDIYIKGIAERKSMGIYYLKNWVIISPFSRNPLDKIKWNTTKDTKTLKQIKDFGPKFFYPLQTEPIDPSEIKVKITHPNIVRGKKQKEVVYTFDFSSFKYHLEAGKYRITIEFGVLAKRLEANGVKDNWNVEIEIMYPER